MNRAELQAKWTTFKIREEPDPECTSCQGSGERAIRSERHPIAPCWCVCFSRDIYKKAREAGAAIAKKGLAELEGRG